MMTNGMPLTLMVLPTAEFDAAIELFRERLDDDGDLLVSALVLVVEEAAGHNDKIAYDSILRRDAKQHRRACVMPPPMLTLS